MRFINLNILCFLLIILLVVVVTSCRGYTYDESSNDDDDFDCELMLQEKIRRNPEKIYLLRTVDGKQRELNKKLIYWAAKFGFEIKSLFVMPQSCGQYDDMTTMGLAAKYGTVINLRAKLVLPKDHKYLSNTVNDTTLIGQSYFGENEQVAITVCNSTDSYKIVDDEKYETCQTDSTVTIYEYIQTVYVKVIISKSITKHKLLVEIIESLDDKDYDMYWKKYFEIYKRIFPHERVTPLFEQYILVCASHENVTQIRKLSNKIIYANHCKNLNEFSEVNIEILAVVTAKPLEDEYLTDLPIIFYDTPSIKSEYYPTYPNSMALFNNYFEILATGFIKLAKRVHWDRIAIISDDSTHSMEFQRAIVGAFTKSNVLYAVKPCLRTKCEFEEALEYLKKYEAKIIIANVEERYVQQLIDSAAKLELTSAAEIVWIFRDLPFDFRGNLKNLDNSYVMKLAPEISKHIEMGSDNIAASVAVVTKTLKEFSKEVDELKRNSTEDVGKSRLHQALASMYKSMRVRTYSVNFQLHTVSHSGQKDVVYTYNLNNQKVIMLKLNYLQVVATTACYFQTRKFETPCNDVLLLVNTLVIFAFLLTVLILFEFFRRFFS